MSLDLGVTIKVDAPQALPTIQKVEQELGKVEARGPTVSSALSQGFRQGTSEAEKLKQSVTSMINPFQGLTDAIQREADMLERIRGPAQRYEQDLQTLDMLLDKNRISTAEYATEVTKLNEALDRTQRVAQDAANGLTKTGEATEKKGLLERLGPLEPIAKAAGIGFGAHELQELSDGYTEVSNKLRVFTNDSASLNALMHETLQVAQDTRMSWDTTASTFQRLSNVTRDLGLSQHQVLDLTKELAEAAKISGASTFEAQMAMSELTHSFATGTMQGREFRVLMRDVPGMMHELQVASGHTQEQFAEMGKHGEITAQLLIEWFGKAKESIADKFAKTTPTASEALLGLKNEAINAVGEIVKATHAGEAFGVAIKVVGDIVKVVGGLFQGLNEAFGSTGTMIGAAAAAMLLIPPPIVAAAAAFEGLNYAANKIVDAFDADMIATTKLNNAIADALLKYDAEMQKVFEQIKAIEQDVVAHSDLFEAVNRAAEAFSAANDIIAKQNDTLVDATKKVDAYSVAVSEVRAKIAQFKSQGLDPNKALTAGDVRILRGYQDAQEAALDETMRYGDVVKDIHEREDKRRRGIDDLKAALHDGVITQREYNEELKKFIAHAEHIKHIYEGMDVYFTRHKVEHLGGFVPELDVNVDEVPTKSPLDEERMRRAMELYNQARTPLEKLRDELAEINDLNNEGFLNDQVADRMRGNLERAFDAEQAKKLTEQWKKELEGIVREEEKTARIVGEIFKPMEDALTSFFETGTFQLDQFASNMERVFAELAVKFLLFKALSGAGVTPTYLNALGLGGFATGGDVTIPHAATGYSGTVGGSGGTDSKLAMMWVTPGEHISVRTPEQMAAQQQAQAPVVHNQNIIQINPRDLLAVMQSGAGQRQTMETIRLNASAIKAMLK